MQKTSTSTKKGKI